MPKEVTFQAGPEYEEWSGSYVVRRLSAYDIMEAGRKFEGSITIDDASLLLSSLHMALSKNNSQMSEEEIKNMPGKLYQVILQIHVKLNMVTKEETAFLSRL